MSKLLTPFKKNPDPQHYSPLKTAKLDKPPTLKIPKGGGLKREYCTQRN